MTTYLYSHPACLKHNPGPDRTYAPKRLTSVLNALDSLNISSLVRRDAPAAPIEALRLVHTNDYIEVLMRPIAEGTQRVFDLDTFAVAGTAEAALRSAGLVMKAVEAVIVGETRNAFCVVSPGGHHAEADTALGFCFFNYVALAGVAALKYHNISRIAVLDFDAHHGNGTQSLFWNHAERLYVSLHEDNLRSGFSHEQGAWNNVLNIPLPENSGRNVIEKALEEQALPKIAAFNPQIILISAGFDMHYEDPLATLSLKNEDYLWLGLRLSRFADDICGGKLVAVLEGGYNLDVLGHSVSSFVQGMTQ